MAENRMQVLVGGEWVHIANVTPDGEIEQTRPLIEGMTLDQGWADEAVIPPAPRSWDLSIAPEDAAHLYAMFDEIDRHERAERARRRLWLRHPFRNAVIR